MSNNVTVTKCHQAGITLLELMITLTVAAVLLVLAIPAFTEFRERTLFRGSTDQLLAMVQNAKFEAVQRDRPVTVTFLSQAGGTVWCVGANEGNAACNCLQPDPAAAGFCNVGSYPALNLADPRTPAEQVTELVRGVRVTVGPNFGGGNRFTINPKLGTLDDPLQFGSVTLRSPSDDLAYLARFDVSPLARASLCAPNAQSHFPGTSLCP